jgi:hypothetical protein
MIFIKAIQMEATKKFILDGLADFGLSDLPGRPYDSAFELLASPPDRKRVIMMGFNGSLVDAHITNAQSIQKDFESPTISNVQNGIEGAWGITHLAKRLQQIPVGLGYDWQDVVYTNALMMCSQNAASIQKEALRQNLSVEQLVKNSMGFFKNVTLQLCNPEVIIAYSNGLTSLSAASLLLKHFGEAGTLKYSHPKGYYTTYAFYAKFHSQRVPVVCVRHMSRFKPHEEYIKSAISLMR